MNETSSKRILQKILKNQEQGELIKFDGQLRLLFFKPLKTTDESVSKLMDLTTKL